MKKKSKPPQNRWKKKAELLQLRLDEALETLDAIQRGAVDALVIQAGKGEQIYSLQNEERPYRILVENMNEGAATVNEHGLIFYCNRRFSEMLRTPLEKVIGSSIYDWISKDITRRSKRLFALGKKRGGQGVFVLNASDKTHLRSLFSISPVEVNGNPGYCLVATDLTQQDKLEHAKRAVEQSRKSEDHFRLIADSIPQLSWISGANGLRYWFNQRWHEYTGTTSEEMKGDGWCAAHDPNIFLEMQKLWNESVSIGKPFEMETQIKGADGQFRTFLTRAVPIRSPKGIIEHWFGTSTDINAIKGVEKALRESEQRYRKLFENMNLGVVYQARDGSIISANPAAERILGLSIAQMQGRKSIDPRWQTIREDGSVLPGTEHPAMISLRTGEKVFNFILGVKRLGEKSHRWLAVDSVPEFLPGQTTPHQVFVTFADITERHQAEAELERARNLMLEAQKIAHLGSFEYDVATAQTIWSEEEFRIYGLDPTLPSPTYAEMIKKHIHTDDVKLLDEAFKQAIQSKSELRIEHRIVQQDGSVRWVDNKAQPYFDEQGKLFRYIGITLDITDRKAADQQLQKAYSEVEAKVIERTDQLRASEDLLRENNALLNSIINGTTDTVFMKDTNGCYQLINLAAEKYFGRRASDVIGKKDKSIYSARDAKVTAASDLFVLESKKVQTAEENIDTAIGPVTFLTTKGPLFDSSGNVTGIFGISRDITRRKQAEEALAISEQKYRSLITSAYDGVMIIRSDDTIEFVNERLETVFGYGPGELINKSYRLLISERDNATRLAVTDQFVAKSPEHKMKSNLNVVGIRKDGSAFPAEISFNPFQSNTELLLNCVVRDITEQNKIQEEKQNLLAKEQALKEEALNANRIKDEFLSTLSHELRTPLTAILGWSQEVISNGLKPDLVKEGLAVIERSALAQGQLIDDLLDVTRIRAGKMVLNVEVIDLADVLDWAVASFRVPAEAKSLTIESTRSVSSCKISADRVRLQQVFGNIISNAIKFTPRGGKIVVKLDVIESAEGKRAQIMITDTGVGIRHENLNHIFERFKQADSSTTRTYGGLGLGLSIVKSLVEMQSGIVSVESDGDGRGTSFRVIFPTIEEAKIKDQSKNLEEWHSIRANFKGMKILVVDDSEDNLHLFSFMLESLGAQVRTAESAKAGIDAVLDFKPDLLLSDISMPGEDGYSFIGKIRALCKEQGGNIPAVALTAYADTESIKKALSAGFNAHIAKPVQKSELVRVLSVFASLSACHSQLEASQ